MNSSDLASQQAIQPASHSVSSRIKKMINFKSSQIFWSFLFFFASKIKWTRSLARYGLLRASQSSFVGLPSLALPKVDSKEQGAYLLWTIEVGMAEWFVLFSCNGHLASRSSNRNDLNQIFWNEKNNKNLLLIEEKKPTWDGSGLDDWLSGRLAS